jgi:hypothetical protein
LISLLVAFAAGYALGMFVAGKWRPFLLCLPVSMLVYLLILIVWAPFLSEGLQLPTIERFIAAGVLQTPLLMLGAYWARRKAKRASVEA